MLDIKYIPESYNIRLINEKGINQEHFVNLQIKYKNEFEKLLMKIIDFKKIDEYIDGYNYNIPIIEDKEYNFYHKYSVLGSKYIYFRNNIHIENLSLEEINTIEDSIKHNKELDINFLINTFKKVIYEEGDIAMFGIPTLENRVIAESLVFEIAYDQKKFEEVSQYIFVKQLKEIIYTSLKNSIKKVIDTDVSMIEYNAIPDIYNNKIT